MKTQYFLIASTLTMKGLVALVFLLTVALSSADTPANCLYEDILGEWVFHETARNEKASVTCEELGEIIYTKTFTLSFPNTVTDELGNVGTWTMVYNQGFEVNINERSYYAFSKYEGDFGNSISYCDQTLNGWVRDRTVRNWSCFCGSKVTPVTPRVTKKLSQPIPDRKYKTDYKLIERINSIQSSWTAKAYPQFEKYTLKDMFMRNGGPGSVLGEVPPTAPASDELKAKVALLPDNFDWRNMNSVNYISPVRDQGNCGSCYIFCSLAALEARLSIVTHKEKDVVFSVQDVLSCSQLSQGCIGGFNYLIAGRYAQDQGLVEEECNPYAPLLGSCEDTTATCDRTYVSEYSYLGGYFGACNEELMLVALVENGPLAVAYMVYDDFGNYENGIYSHTGEKSEFNPLEPVNHGVTIVGYGLDEATREKFWIVKNSWGADWGEEGYFRIRRGTNECGIESMAVEATPIP